MTIFPRFRLPAVCAGGAAAMCFSVGVAAAQTALNNKEFRDYDQVERDAARTQGRRQRYEAFRVCADPGNLPLSDKQGAGYENKIAEVIARALGTTVTYFWRPFLERGVTRQTFETNSCDVFIDVPFGYGPMLTTEPLYRSTYVLAYRDDRGIAIGGLDDPALKKLQVGVYELSALRQALSNYGVVANVQVHEVSYDGDLVPAHQPWRQVQDVVDGKLDVAGVWGPMAGWLKAMQHAPLVIQPTNIMDDTIPMEFDMAIGMRKTDVVRKYAVEHAIETHRDEIRAILDGYGVPLVECGECVISGALKAHGLYTAPAISAAEAAARAHEAPPVPREELDRWLAAGADVNRELADAVLASDADRVIYLLGKGADVNQQDPQGLPPLAVASQAGDIDTMTALLAHGARPDEPDTDGWTPLLHAAYRNRTDAVQLLLAHGADPDRASKDGYTPLAIAAEEKRFDAALALIGGGAHVDVAVSPGRLTALMVVASETPPENRAVKLTQTAGPIEVARALLAHGANVNAISVEKATPLMIAAARDNSAMIGVLIQAGADRELRNQTGQTAHDIAVANDNPAAIRTLDLLSQGSPVSQ